MKTFIPVITINNKSEQQEVEINGEKQIVEVHPTQGFNIKTRDDEGNYTTAYFVKDLEAVILKAKYQVQSKFSQEEFFMSNEFDNFTDSELVIFAPKLKQVLFKGNYKEACVKYDTGIKNKMGKAVKAFDVYVVLYLLYNGQTYRFMWKMNQNCNWFDHKTEISLPSGQLTYANKTKFPLEKKTVGKTTFWATTAAVGDSFNPELAKAELEKLDAKMKAEEDAQKEETQKREETKASPEPELEINVNNIPF